MGIAAERSTMCTMCTKCNAALFMMMAVQGGRRDVKATMIAALFARFSDSPECHFLRFVQQFLLTFIRLESTDHINCSHLSYFLAAIAIMLMSRQALDGLLYWFYNY